MMGDYSFAEPNAFNTTANVAKEKVRRVQNIFPVCIRQIRDCKEEEFTIFGSKPKILKIVAILRDYDVSSTKVTYTIEDHTGKITAIFWLETDGDQCVKLPSVKEGHYVKIFGSYRITNDEKSLLVLKIFPVDKINEVTTHLLEVVHARFAIEEQSKEGSQIQIQNNPGMQLSNTMNSIYSTGIDNVFTPMQKKVYDILKADRSDNGVIIDKILSHFAKNQETAVRQAVDYLANEGHVFVTIDHNHFKVTD